MFDTDFLRGMCVGLVVGAIAEKAVMPKPRSMKTSVGKKMEAVGNAVDSAVDSLSRNIGM